jgi:hypothetical protein
MPSGVGAQSGWHSVGGYPQPYGYPQARKTNGFAIASLVCSVAGFFAWVLGPILGIVFGVLALRATSSGREAGRGLAISGIVVGSLMLLLNVGEIVAVVHGHTGTTHGGGGLSTLYPAG